MTNSKRKKIERQTFADVKAYDELMSRPYFRSLKQKITQELKKYSFEKKKILEVGAGKSEFLKLFDSRNEVTALDLSPDLLAQNQTRAKLVVGDAEKLPFKDKSFDFVYLVGVLHHLENQKKALKEIKRVLKEKGRIFISEPTKISLNLPYYLIRKLMIFLMGQSKYQDLSGCGSPEESFLDESTVKEVFDQNWQVKSTKILPLRMPPIGFLEELWSMKINNIWEKIPLFNNLGTIIFLEIQKKSDHDLGFGTEYEKYILRKIAAKLTKKYKVKLILEYPKTSLLGEGNIFDLPEKQIKPDLVWNFCAFEQAKDTRGFVIKMTDLTDKYALIITQNYLNPGVLIHWFWHLISGKKWDHGNLGKMSGLSAKQTFLNTNNWKLREWGAFDIPWFILDVYETGQYLRDLPFLKNKITKICESRFESWPKELKFILAHHHFLLLEKNK